MKGGQFGGGARLAPIRPARDYQLLSYRHLMIPFNVQVPNEVLNDVRWDNIDPSSWPSGDYLLSIITRDEYGNEGIAPTSFSLDPLKPNCNPWRVHVASGK
jgi:hypothetical protein